MNTAALLHTAAVKIRLRQSLQGPTETRERMSEGSE